MRSVGRRIRTYYRNLLLRHKISLIFSVLFTVLLIVQGSVIYNISVRVIRNEMESASKQTIEQTSLNVDSYFEEIKTIVQLTANNRTLIDSVENYFSSYYDQLKYNENLQNILIQYTYMIPYVDNILVIKDGRAIYDKNSSTRKDFDFNKEEWFKEGLSQVVKATFVGPHRNDYYYDPSSANVISVVIPVRDPFKPNLNAGAIAMDIDIEKITSLFGHIGLDDSQDISIIDSRGQVVANRDESAIGQLYHADYLNKILATDKGTIMVSGKRPSSLVVYSTSPVTGWKTVITTRLTKIGQVADNVRFTALITIVAAIALAMATSLLISSKMTKGIIHLKNRMDLLSRGNDPEPIRVESNDEVGMLGRHFNRMVLQLNQLINENYIVKIKQKEAELKALQGKINPHFLNNTLQSLHAMAVLKKTDDIETTIESLSKLFNYVLYESDDIVRAADEMSYLDSYLQIMQSRNRKRFDYRIEADPAVANCRIPKLLIQPLAENALLHGLDAKPSGGLIVVEAGRHGDRVRFKISDNGQGMSEEQVDRIYRSLEQEEPVSSHIGFKSVYDRLTLLYGEQFGFRIESIPGEGTVIAIEFPLNC